MGVELEPERTPTPALPLSGGGRKAVFITGAAKRVGAVIAGHFAANGYDIALHYQHSEEEALAVQKRIQVLGVECVLFQKDLTHVAALPSLMEQVRKALPRCNALVNNASIFERAGFMETDEALFDRQFAVNFKAPFFLTQSFARTFGEGCVVNLIDSDIASHHISHFAYLLSKKSLAAFTTMAARELGPDVRVNGVCPGCIIPSDQNDTSYEQKMQALIPLKSHPTPQQLAEVVHWLAVQRHITGQLIYVDGGKHVI